MFECFQGTFSRSSSRGSTRIRFQVSLKHNILTGPNIMLKEITKRSGSIPHSICQLGFDRYPNLPTVMRSDRTGAAINVTRTWAWNGLGLPRIGCVLEPAWNAWTCPIDNGASTYRMLVLENLDADKETRRIRCTTGTFF